jgi:tetratricopeptide (TPR) repeat protein
VTIHANPLADSRQRERRPGRASWLPLALLCLVTGASATDATRQPQPSAIVVRALERYDAGQHQAAISGFDLGRITVVQFQRAIEQWLARSDQAGDRRRAVAAAYALEVAWAMSHTPSSFLTMTLDDGKSEPSSVVPMPSRKYIAVWVARLLDAGPVPKALEHTLWLTTVAMAQDAQAWRVLSSQILPLARTRWPGDPRFRLADVVARTNADLWPLRTDNRAARVPATSFRDADALQEDRLSSAAAARIPAAEREFEPLLREPALAGEAALRIGYLRLHRRDWHGALISLTDAKAALNEPTLIAAADYLSGWVLEQLGRPHDAIAAYRQALAITPDMQMLGIRLSALLFLSSERKEAYVILDRVLNADPAPTDLLLAIDRGDARFVPGWLVSIRKALE